MAVTELKEIREAESEMVTSSKSKRNALGDVTIMTERESRVKFYS